MSQLVNLSQIRPNPFIDDFYGKFSFQSFVDIQFIKNIQENGVKVPLIVSKDGLIISGNRRYYCAKQITEIEKIPVLFEDVLASEVTESLIISLQQYRIKSDVVLAREFKLLGEIYDIRKGTGKGEKQKEGKKLRQTIINESGFSETNIKRLVECQELIIDLKNVSESKAWENISKLREKGKKVNSILRQLKEVRGERDNPLSSKKIKEPKSQFFKIYSRSCEDLSDIIDDNVIACVATSPPYYGGIRSYSEDGKNVKEPIKPEELEQLGHEKTPELYVEKLVRYIRECRRTLKETGSIWINVMDVRKDGSYFNVPEKLLLALESEGLITAQKCIWFKNNPPYDNNNVFQPSMEHIFHFVLDAKKYKWVDDWFDKNDDFLDNFTYGNKEKRRKFRNVFFYPTNKTERNKNDGAGYSSSILSTNVANNSYLKKILAKKGLHLQHNALFALDVPAICLLSTTTAGDSVLDIFSGMGTTGLIAYANNCKYIGIELSSVYKAKSIVRFEDFLQNNPNIKRDY